MGLNAYATIKRASALLSPAGSTLEIIRLSNGNADRLGDFISALESDPTLCDRLLRLVNSRVGGVARKTTSVADAIHLLGVLVVKNLALGLSLVDNHREGPCGGFDYEGFWSRVLARAVAGRSITRRVTGFFPHEVFILGLLSDIGRLGLATAFSEEYRRILISTDLTDEIQLRSREQESFGIDHTTLATEIIKEWGLQESYCLVLNRLGGQNDADAVLTDRTDRLLCILLLANAIAATLIDPTNCGESLKLADRRADTLGISKDSFPSLFDAIACEWREIGLIFSVETWEVPSHDQLRSAAGVACHEYPGSPHDSRESDAN